LKSLKSAASVVKSNLGKSAHIIQPQSNKMDNQKIIYNKKAESEFFVDNSALAGFSGERILYMAVRELIENALDSCETFSILPSIKITLKTFDQTNDLWLLSCEDNGTGINSDKLPVAVCSFLTSAKYMEKQQRGLFGVGLKMVAAFSTKDTDFPIRVWSKSIEETEEYYFELRTDIGTNKPIVLKKSINKSEPCIKSNSGFKIKVILRARLVPITKNKIYDYVTQSSIVNPYALITFETDDGTFTFDRRTSIMPNPAKEILPHPSDMDLQTLKKAISKYTGQKVTLAKILCSSFQKLSYEKAKEILSASQLNLDIKNSISDLSEHDLIKIVNICKKTKFQNPNTDHLSPIGQEILTIGMMSEYTIVSNKNSDHLNNDNRNFNNDIIIENKVNEVENTDSYREESKTERKFNTSISKSNFSVKVLQPVLTAYTSRIGIINNRPTIVETGLAYGGDINSFKLYRFANKIPLLYDEGSDVAREVVSEVEINKMGITKKQAKEQFSSNKDSKRDRIIEVLPIHIFFHICSTKIPYKTAGKESIASEGELKSYMKACLSELYRKLSSQIRKELKIKEAENKLKLYKHYLPFIVDAINDSLGIKNSKLNESFSLLIESHLAKKSNINDVIDEGNNVVSHDIMSEPSDSTLSPSFRSPKIEKKIKRTESTGKSKNVSITNQKERKHNDPESFLNHNNIKTNKINKSIIDNNKHLKNSKDRDDEKNSKIRAIKNKTINPRPTLDSFHSQRRVNKGK
jgi:DNA topoisomerase-6 subunit B